jgi:1-deoxy-D-xylulose-5-phosphate reductoisomerase
MKRLCILGSTGSIGENCLRVVEALPDRFQVTALSTRTRVDRLLAQAERFRPCVVAIASETPPAEAVEKLRRLDIQVLTGPQSVAELAGLEEVDLVVNALVGSVGVRPTLAAIAAGHSVALANKETLVAAGEVVMKRARKRGVDIIPIDSEHSALLQCLMGERRENIARVIITASGGPFRTLDSQKFGQVTIEQALSHPNWSMGDKITIDSATLMNKGLEVIEAHWLFGLAASQIEVVIHPQSIIHSLVEFADGSVKAQLGLPDMRLPIQFALTYPERAPSDFPRLNLLDVAKLTFEAPDLRKFRALALAYEALETGGTAPAVLNAANEAAVRRFLRGEIRFDQIPVVVEEALRAHSAVSGPSIDEIFEADSWARRFVADYFASEEVHPS